MNGFKIPTLKLATNEIQQQQLDVQTPGSATDDDMSEDEEEVIVKPQIPSLKLNFSLPTTSSSSSHNTPTTVDTSRSNTSASTTPMSSQRSLSSLSSPGNSVPTTKVVPSLNLMKGTSLPVTDIRQKSPQKAEPKSIVVDLLVPNFCKCTIGNDVPQHEVGAKIADQIHKKWFNGQSSSSFELHKLSPLSQTEGERFACQLNNTDLSVSIINELIAQNQALNAKVQKTMEAMLVYQTQNHMLRQTITKQKQELQEANATKQEMKNIVDSLLYQHQLLATAMTEKPVPIHPSQDVKVVAPKKSKRKPIKRKQKPKK